MAELSGSLEELLRGHDHAEDWVRITVTDRLRPDLMFDRVKARYPHVLQVFHIPEGSAPQGSQSDGVRAPRQNPRELAADFIAYVSGIAADDTELELFDAAYQQAAIEMTAS
jgi:exonuclease SbcD